MKTYWCLFVSLLLLTGGALAEGNSAAATDTNKAEELQNVTILDYDGKEVAMKAPVKKAVVLDAVTPYIS